MNEYKQCSKCDEWHWSAEPCLELFAIIDKDLGKTKKEVRAWSFNDAASRYARFRKLLPIYGALHLQILKISTKETRNYIVSAAVEVSYKIKGENTPEVICN